MAESKLTTGSKLRLGAIVVGAGLARADRAFPRGDLVQMADIPTGSAEHERLKRVGVKAFVARSSSSSDREVG